MSAFIFLVIVLLAGIILLAVVSGGGNKRRRHNYRSRPQTPAGRLDPAENRNRWDTIMATSLTGASGLKSALNEADKLFDLALRQSGVPGDTMGERLKAARDHFASDRALYDAVWRAHKLRNALAHEVGFDLVPSQAREALNDFERGLRTLGAIR